MKTALAIFGLALITGLVECGAFGNLLRELDLEARGTPSGETWWRPEIKDELTNMRDNCDTGVKLWKQLGEKNARSALTESGVDPDHSVLGTKCKWVHKTLKRIDTATTQEMHDWMNGILGCFRTVISREKVILEYAAADLDIKESDVLLQSQEPYDACKNVVGKRL